MLNLFQIVFIYPDASRPLEWVQLCADRLRVDRGEASAMLANLTGYRTWPDLLVSFGTRKPSPVDERLDYTTRSARQNHYVRVLVEVFGVNPGHATRIIAHMSPTSGSPWLPFDLDPATLHDPLMNAEPAALVADLIARVSSNDFRC